MAVSSEYIATMRRRLRESATIHDSEITDLINAARADLMRVGIIASKVEDESNPLVTQAVATYLKAEFGLDNEDADKYRASYREQRNGLALSESYINAEEA